MGDNKDYKDLIILGIVAIGISIAWFAYLVYIRDREIREKIQPVNQLSNLNTLSPNIPLIQTDIPTHPVYDERLYQLLENQQDQLKNINSNIDSLKSLNATQYRTPYQKDIVNIANKSARAGSVTSIKTTTEDKTRQKEFGMI